MADKPEDANSSLFDGIIDTNLDVGKMLETRGDHSFIAELPIPSHPNTSFDEEQFRQLLAGSLSLVVEEKQRIISVIPLMSQEQIDELFAILRHEQHAFGELAATREQRKKSLSEVLEQSTDVADLVSNPQDASFIIELELPPHPDTEFDEDRFKTLLAGSISLSPTEKRRLLESVHLLDQVQIDKLTEVFVSEQNRFGELGEHYGVLAGYSVQRQTIYKHRERLEAVGLIRSLAVADEL